jgi:hypothetical protein
MAAKFFPTNGKPTIFMSMEKVRGNLLTVKAVQQDE